MQAGDTLIGLAKKHEVSVEDLATTNNMATNTGLKRGQVILVPKTPTKAEPKKDEPKKSNPKDKAKKTTTHTVKAGENLTNLAKKYGVSVAELAKMNNLEPTTQLKSGQKLTVPSE